MAVLAALIAFLVALGLTRYFCNPDSWLHLLDHPNARSLHTKPIPRTGGVAVLGGLLAGAAVLSSDLTFAPLSGLLLGAVPIALVSFWDDYQGVPVGIRLVIHGLSASILLMAGYGPAQLDVLDLSRSLSPGLTSLFLALSVIWMINLYNFMDGMDGLAAGMAMVGFSCFAVLGFRAGNALFANTSLLIVAASAGFLVFNRPPARIFLGDIGSTILGFLAAAYSLWGNRQGLFPLWVALLVFSPFVFDATLTLLRRLRRGERVWQAHKTHYYQRLIQNGWSQRRVLLAEYALMFVCSLSALYAVRASTAMRIAVALSWVLVYSSLALGIGRLEKRGAWRTS